MIITTTPTIEGHQIKEYKGLVSGEVVFGMNFVKDFFAGLHDFFGGRSGGYEESMIKGRQTAQKEMEEKAAKLGANAIVGVSYVMAKYTRELFRGISAAKLMGISRAVVHPISFYSSEKTYGDWVRANIAFLSPVVEYAKSKGVRLCVENMPSEKEAPDNHLYGSCALNISALAEKLGIGVCWDVGHANISGYKQSEQMQILKDKIEVLHIHDNGGHKDAHLIPFDGSVDWSDVAKGIKESEFCGILDVEVTAWALSGDRAVRENFGKTIVSRAHRLMEMADLIG